MSVQWHSQALKSIDARGFESLIPGSASDAMLVNCDELLPRKWSKLIIIQAYTYISVIYIH